MDKVFKALSDPSRRKILEILKQKDMTVTEINQHFPMTMASLSHHLAILKQANLVVTERQGQFIYYSLNTSVFEEITKIFINLFAK
jgi:ArsR family transcriptional regulator, arsenate/arsenite/antimonite-responsive transcriptional repressor